MATIKPVWVVISATEIPAAMALALPVPNTVITSKVCIMPTTVPSSPSKGATADSTRMAARCRSREAHTPITVSSRINPSSSRSWVRRARNSLTRRLLAPLYRSSGH